jgi:hypothetical protein
MKLAKPTSARAPVGASGGYRVTGCAHARGSGPGRSPGTNSPLDCLCPGSLPRAGSLARRFESNQAGPPPLLRYAGHPAASAWSRGCLHRPSNANALPRALWWGAVWSEVMEEGRIDSARSACRSTGPGDMNATRHPAAALSLHPTRADGAPRTAATGRKLSLAHGHSFDASRVARSAVEQLT